MSTSTEQVRLSSVLAANVRAQAAMRGWTQREMCRRLNMTPVMMSDRYREKTPWTLDETQKLADLFGVEVRELLARPKGFEPLTFWLGPDHTVTYWLEEVAHPPAVEDGGGGRRRAFCDSCGWDAEGPAAYFTRVGAHVAEHNDEGDLDLNDVVPYALECARCGRYEEGEVVRTADREERAVCLDCLNGVTE